MCVAAEGVRRHDSLRLTFTGEAQSNLRADELCILVQCEYAYVCVSSYLIQRGGGGELH